MAKFFVNKNQIQGEKILLEGEDVKHIKDVLRNKKGDILNICDGENTDYNCKIEDFFETSILLTILSKEASKEDTKIKIDLFQALPKFEKMELIIQKTTELGINEIFPIETKRIVVKLDEKAKEKKIIRWKKIVAEASKQCKRSSIPRINDIISIKNVVEKLEKYDIVLVAYENEKQKFIKTELSKHKDIKNIAIVIGPEGGLDEQDLVYLKENQNCKTVSLGKNILRTETAGLVVLAILKYEFNDM